MGQPWRAAGTRAGSAQFVDADLSTSQVTPRSLHTEKHTISRHDTLPSATAQSGSRHAVIRMSMHIGKTLNWQKRAQEALSTMRTVFVQFERGSI